MGIDKLKLGEIIEEFIKRAIKAKEQGTTKGISTVDLVSEYNGLYIQPTFGKGRSARIPIISFLKKPFKISYGVYPYIYFDYENKKIGLEVGSSYKKLFKLENSILKEIEAINSKLSKEYRFNNDIFDKDAIKNLVGNIVEDITKLIDEFNNISFDGQIFDFDVDHALNLILYGPPGTGKTYHTIQISLEIISEKENDSDFRKILEVTRDVSGDTQKLKEKFDEYRGSKKGQIEFVTFHQSYGYEEFVEGIKAETRNGQVEYRIRDGVFKRLCNLAEKNTDKNYVLIIDEINRGNISKIFGELITLIEPSKRKGAEEELEVTLPYSGDRFSVPKNLYIIGTMNTADRSIALMDTALRRRFNFVEMMPEPELLDFEVRGIHIGRLLEVINERIEYLYDRDHTVGHSYFMRLDKNSSLDELNDVFKNNIIPLLQEYFYDDWEKIQMVLGDHPQQSKNNEDKFIVETYVEESKLFGFNHDDIEEHRYIYKVNQEFTEGAYKKIIVKSQNEDSTAS